MKACPASVDRADEPPVWVTVWGGPNTLAQALWDVRASRSAAETETFVAKLRICTISDQDDSGPWLRREFPNLLAEDDGTPPLFAYRRAIIQVTP